MIIVHQDNMEHSSKHIDFKEAPPIGDPNIPVADIPWSPPPIDPLPELGDTERAKLIDTLTKKTERSEVDPAYWACLWFPDIECLREIVRVAECSKSNASYGMISDLPFTMIRACGLLPPFIPPLSNRRKY